MPKSVAYILTSVITAVIISSIAWFFGFLTRPNTTKADLTAAMAAAQHTLALQAQRLDGQLSAFADVVTADRDFSMKVLVEKNPTAPEVTELAGKFIGPMGFGLLEISDSAGIVLSSGHFPANAQTPLLPQVKLLSESPMFLLDNCKGSPCLTLQLRKKSLVADVPFYCHGGFIVDDAFVTSLLPMSEIKPLIKAGNMLIGMPGVTSMSECKGDTVVINNKTYAAVSFDLPGFGFNANDKPTLIIIKQTKEKD